MQCSSSLMSNTGRLGIILTASSLDLDYDDPINRVILVSANIINITSHRQHHGFCLPRRAQVCAAEAQPRGGPRNLRTVSREREQDAKSFRTVWHHGTTHQIAEVKGHNSWSRLIRNPEAEHIRESRGFQYDIRHPYFGSC